MVGLERGDRRGALGPKAPPDPPTRVGRKERKWGRWKRLIGEGGRLGKTRKKHSRVESEIL